MGVWIGISGWRYAPWRGVFYPAGLAQKHELGYAAQRFSSIELNGSFYSLQRPESYARWYRESPEGFLFSIKGSRFITHMLRLKNVETALANFFASGLFELNEKLGPFLWQLPPTLSYDSNLLEGFFDLLPRTGGAASKLARKHDGKVTGRARLKVDGRQRFRHAVEVRHPSFVQAGFIDLLRRRDIALVVSDAAGAWPFMEDVTTDFVYVRLHGDTKIYESGYSEHALDVWSARIHAWMNGRQVEAARTIAGPPRRTRRDVFVYFDNDAKVHAPFDAMRLAAKV